MAQKKFAKKASFVLNEAQINTSESEQKMTTILLTFACKDGRFKYSIQQSILPKDWDSYNYRAKRNNEVNSELDKFIEYVEEYFEQFPRIERKAKIKSVTKQDLKKWLDIKTNRVDERKDDILPDNENTITFFGEVRKLIDRAKRGEELHGKFGSCYSAGSIKNWEKTLRILKEFDPELSFDIDRETYEAFKLFCNNKQNPKTNEKGYTANYVGSLIKDWKTFMEKTTQFHNNTFYRSKEFVRMSEEIALPYLNDADIEKIKNAEGLTAMQEIIRDRFMINLFNGLRISDMEKLDIEKHFDFDNDQIIIQTYKTGKIVAVPIADETKEILKKYNGQLPKQYHRNVVNRELKKIGLLAKLNDTVQFVKMVGGKRTLVKGKKHEFLSNHTARRSHATNFFKSGGDLLTGKSILGMSIKTMELYNKRTAQENANMAKSLSIYSNKKNIA